MARIKLIHHINVQVSDRARTREWYEKVLGAEFLDRSPALNKRQLQLRLGSGEIHFTETPHPTTIASGHFALEVFGPRGIVELAAVMGNYAGTAIMLNMIDQQLRPDQTPLL